MNSKGQAVHITPTGFVDSNDNTKDYIVIEVPNQSKENIYTSVKKFVNTNFNNPKFVTSEVLNEQIVVDARDSDPIKVVFRLSGSNIWHFNYKYTIDFKEGKIKFTPYFKYLDNEEDNQQIGLTGVGVMGNASGLFNKNGKPLREKANSIIDESVGKFVKDLTEFLINKTDKKDW